MFKNPSISFAPTQSAPKPIRAPQDGPRPSHGLASRHEPLFLRLTALHKDVSALAARRGRQELSETVRILAEGLMADAAPFGGAQERLPVAAPDLAGL